MTQEVPATQLRQARALKVADVSAGVLLGVGILSLGLPGGFLFWLSTFLVLGRDGTRDLEADAVWPIMIVVGVVAPLGIEVMWWTALSPKAGEQR